MQANVDDIVTVSDAQPVETMRFFAERMKIIVEPTGCLAAAAIMLGEGFEHPQTVTAVRTIALLMTCGGLHTRLV